MSAHNIHFSLKNLTHSQHHLLTAADLHWNFPNQNLDAFCYFTKIFMVSHYLFSLYHLDFHKCVSSLLWTIPSDWYSSLLTLRIVLLRKGCLWFKRIKLSLYKNLLLIKGNDYKRYDWNIRYFTLNLNSNYETIQVQTHDFNRKYFSTFYFGKHQCVCNWTSNTLFALPICKEQFVQLRIVKLFTPQPFLSLVKLDNLKVKFPIWHLQTFYQIDIELSLHICILCQLTWKHILSLWSRTISLLCYKNVMFLKDIVWKKDIIYLINQYLRSIHCISN